MATDAMESTDRVCAKRGGAIGTPVQAMRGQEGVEDAGNVGIATTVGKQTILGAGREVSVSGSVCAKDTVRGDSAAHPGTGSPAGNGGVASLMMLVPATDKDS